MNARRASLRLLYESVNISSDIEPYLKSFTFTDNVGSADDLQITLADPAGLWSGDWFPTKGAKLTATICVTDWESEGDTAELYCGRFFIDEITMQGPELTVTIKAKSAPVGTAKNPAGGSVQHQRKTRAWEATTLKTAAAQIAAESGLRLYFDLPQDISLERRDQREQSDLAFLQRVAAAQGAWVKVSDGKLIVFDKEKAEAGAPAAAIIRTAWRGRLSSWNFTAGTTQQYRSCKVTYYDPAKKLTYTGTATAETVETGQDLVLSERVESQAEAQRVAAVRLKQAAASNVTGSLSMMGDVRLSAGITLDLSDFGVFDGRYFVDTATHSVDASGGYKTTVQIHRGKKE